MKLELKHLAPYLPYGLKCKLKDQGKETIGELSGCYSDNSYAFFDTVESEHGFEDIKPILRPLKDLTKPHFHDGTENQNTRFWEFEIRKGYIVGLGYDSFVELIKHHYDVFGLIPKGLAIDINTIEN